MSSLREQIELRRASKSPRRPNSCYSTSSQAPCLSVSPRDETEWIFPWRLWSYSSHEVQSDREILTIGFLSNQIRIEGWNLKPLAKAVVNTTLDKVQVIPSAYRDPTDSEPFVAEIKVQKRGEDSTEEN